MKFSSALWRLLAVFGAGGMAMACNTGGEATWNPLPDTEMEPNDTVAEATYGGGPGVTDARGTCESTGALDHFAMTAGTAGTAAASLGATVTIGVALLTSDGTLLADSPDTAAPFDVSATVGTGGIVVLRITCNGTGNYDGWFETQ